MENPAFNQQQIDSEGVKNLLNGDLLGNLEGHLKSLNGGLQRETGGNDLAGSLLSMINGNKDDVKGIFEAVKTSLGDTFNQETIKNGLDAAKGLIGANRPEVLKAIDFDCLEKDITNPDCFDLSGTSSVGDSDRLTATSKGFDLRVSSAIIYI